MKLLSFDIEISDVFDLKPGEDLEKYAPFHISVAATAIEGGEEKIWYSKGDNDQPALNLSRSCATDLLSYLDEMQRQGYRVCAWNGLGFDLKWLGHQAQNMELAGAIALKSYDPMFQFFCQAGFPVALSKVAEAMKIDQEKLMDGADAPREWRARNFQKVMDYCLGDCQMTNLVVGKILEARAVRWLTARGTVSSKPMPTLKQVDELIPEPKPDQSWMSSPIPKEKFYSWIEGASGL